MILILIFKGVCGEFPHAMIPNQYRHKHGNTTRILTHTDCRLGWPLPNPDGLFGSGGSAGSPAFEVPKNTEFFQRLSIDLQRGNAALLIERDAQLPDSDV